MRKDPYPVPPCSVIICTYNRAHMVKRALRSLATQTVGPDQFEVIVVNDGSRDNTTEVCREMGTHLPNLRFLSLGRNEGLAFARNYGISASTGKYLLFTDDDCIAARDWVEKMRDALHKEEIVAGAVQSTATSFLKLCHNIAQFHAFMPGQQAGPKDMLPGANMAFRRSILKTLKGFQPGIECADDTEFSLRARAMGYRIFFSPDARVAHDPERTTFSSIMRYAASHASITIHIRNRYKSLLKTPSLFTSPVLILALSPLIALKVTAGIYRGNRSLTRLFWSAPLVYLLKLAWCWGAAKGLRNTSHLDEPA